MIPVTNIDVIPVTHVPSQPTPTIIPVAGPAQLEDYFISPKTVWTQIQRILSKLDVHSRTEAVALAYR